MTTTHEKPKAGPPPWSARRPALIATAIALPITILLALAFTTGRHEKGSSTSTPAGALSVADSTVPDAAQTPCESVSEKLPITLNGLAPRAVHGPPFVVAWGVPSVVYRCGVARPSGLNPQSGQFVIDTGTGPGRTVEWFPVKKGNQTVYTAIDRAAYIEVTVPGTRQGGELISTLSGYVAAALPAVCQAFPVNPPSNFNAALEKSLCVNRKG